MQTAGDFVCVLVEFAACVQFGHDDFCRAAFRLVLVVPLDAGLDAATVVGDGDGVVRVDGDVDVGAVTGQRFIDGVVQHFKYAVVQTGTVRRITNVHTWALAHCFQPFEDLDGGRTVLSGLRLWGVVVRDRGHGYL